MIGKLEGMGSGTSDASLIREQAQLEARLRSLEDVTRDDVTRLQAQLTLLEAQASKFDGLDSEVKQARSDVDDLASTINSKLAGHAQQLNSQQTFHVQENSERWVDHVRVDFDASHWEASRKYTCVYQFGVYGKGSLP